MYVCIENTMLGQNVLFLRRRKCMNRKYFADLVGMTQWEVLALESGELTDIYWKHLDRICILFNMNSNFLCDKNLEELYRHRQVYCFPEEVKIVPPDDV